MLGETQLDGIVTFEVDNKMALSDVHVFGANYKWALNLHSGEILGCGHCKGQ